MTVECVSNIGQGASLRTLLTAFAEKIEVALVRLLALPFAFFLELACLVASDRTADVEGTAMKHKVLSHGSRRVRGK